MRPTTTYPNPRVLFLALFAALVLLPTFASAHESRADRISLVSVAHVSGATGGCSTCVPCCEPKPNCCDVTRCCDPCITYHRLGLRRVCCDPCLEPIKQVLTFCHPATGCHVEVPICVPGCCSDCPEVCERCTLFGCGAKTYRWCCGFSATIRFAANGDIRVIYRG